MRSYLFLAFLLGAAPASTDGDYASMDGGTWCVTYESTYLAPAANNGGNAPDTDKTEPGRVPVPPSIRPTFGKNSSIARSRSTTRSSGMGEETSPLSESLSATSLLDVTESQSELNPPSSDQTTEAVSTTTGIVEPNGQSVIFLVLAPDNQKRQDNNNGQAPGGFVGNDNPSVCTFANVFNLGEGQLFENGLPIFYSGEAYKELSSQGVPPSDAITKTFSGSGQTLSFSNEDLPNGQAGFCQDSSGRVYITFSSAPPGCVTVTLASYNVAQCQNGRLIGVDDLSSSVSEISSETSISDVSSSATGETTGTDLPESASLSSSQVSSVAFEGSTTPSSDMVESSTSLGDSTSAIPGSESSTEEQSASSQGSTTDLDDSSTISESSIETSTLAESATISDESTTSEATSEATSSPAEEDTSTNSGDTTKLSSTTDGETSTTADDDIPTSTDNATSNTVDSNTESSTTTDNETSTRVDGTTVSTTTADDAISTSTYDVTSSIVDDNSSQASTSAETTTTQEDTSTTGDACLAGLRSAGGSPDFMDRVSDCAKTNEVTVSPYTVTKTVMSKRWEHVIPTGWPTPRPTPKQLARRQNPTATTIQPTNKPDYATYCDSAEDYYEACSSLGITRGTTTLPTPTKTVTDTQGACRFASMVKRAGEGMGYAFAEDFDVIDHIPGWRF